MQFVKNPHSHFPVCRDSMDKVLGVVRTEDLLTSFLIDEKIDLKKNLHKPIFVPETLDALKVLELFKKTGIHMAFVVVHKTYLQVHKISVLAYSAFVAVHIDYNLHSEQSIHPQLAHYNHMFYWKNY